jgi:hypothetical protein
MNYSYSQKWLASAKSYGVEVFHWKAENSTLNNWTLTATIFPSHSLYKKLEKAFSNKSTMFEDLGEIIPFFLDNVLSFDKTRYAIKISCEYTDTTSLNSNSKSQVDHIFQDSENLHYFLKETAYAGTKNYQH